MAQVMPEFVMGSDSRPALAQALRELWASREVVWAFAERDTRVKYKQAFLGAGWVVLQPLAFLAVFFVVFGRVARISGGGVSYPAFALAALVPWFFIQTAVSFGAQALLLNSALVRKVYFPREAPVLGAVIGAGLDFAIGFVLLLIAEPMLGGRISWAVLLAVPLWLVLAVLTSGVAMGLGALNVYYRDFRYGLPLILQFWMFASPVAYPIGAVPEHWRPFYAVVNPAAGILDGFRRTLAEGMPPHLGLLALSTATAFAVAWGGYWVFKRLESGFAETI